MALYDKASLVLIPSGTKEGTIFSQKPTNGDGDFTFSRSTSATRVGPSGYIEKERGNLLTYSNDFSSGDWIYRSGDSSTSGQTGYDGSSDAWLLNVTNGGWSVYQDFVSSGVYSLSLYVKAGTLDEIQIDLFSSSKTYSGQFNLTSGTDIGGYNTIDRTITDVGSGWYRVSISANVSSTLYVRIGSVSTTGNFYIQDAQLEQGLVARDYIETTTSAVYGGITDNIPRLDYNESCPSLLLEPQRTNLIGQSEYFNTFWSISANVSITDNYATSPEGFNNASRWVSSGGSYPQISRLISGLTIGQSYTASFYVKSDGTSQIQQTAWFTGFAGTTFTPSNEWVRITNTFTATATTHAFVLFTNSAAAAASSYLLYGVQVEQGSYATSYIPTYGGAAVTRNGAIINTGTSSTNEIGQQSGVIYAEFKSPIEGAHTNWLSLSNGSSTNDWIFIGKDNNKMRSYLRANNVVIFSNTSPLLTGDYQKVALRYDNNNSAIFINGVKIAEYPSATYEFSQTLNRVSFGTPYSTAGEKTNWKQVVIFPTALTDEEAIALTTI